MLTTTLTNVRYYGVKDPKDRLCEWREDRRLKFVDLGKLLGCDPTYVSAIESGKRIPGRRIANAIARVARIPATDWDRVEDQLAT